MSDLDRAYLPAEQHSIRICSQFALQDDMNVHFQLPFNEQELEQLDGCS